MTDIDTTELIVDGALLARRDGPDWVFTVPQSATRTQLRAVNRLLGATRFRRSVGYVWLDGHHHAADVRIPAMSTPSPSTSTEAAAVPKASAVEVTVDIDTASVLNLTITICLDGCEHEYEVRPTPRRRPWLAIAYDIADRIARAGGLPGSDRGLSGYRIRVSAELRGVDDEVDITKQILAEGWRRWLRVDRDFGSSASGAPGFRSSPERDARVRADEHLAGCTPSSGQHLERKLDEAIAVEDAAMLARLETIGAPFEAPAPVEDPVEVASPAEPHLDLTPALDRLDRHHDAAVAAARAARDAAERAEAAAMAVFLAAQEVRRQAQNDLDEVLAVGELFEATWTAGGADEAEGGDWLRAPDGPDADAPEVFLQDVPGSERPLPPETEDDRHWLRFAA